MFCSNCGKENEKEVRFCGSCGTDFANPNAKPKNSAFKKILMIIGGIVLGFIILFTAIFMIVSFTSESMVCRSPEGNITIMYNDNRITGYRARNMTFNMSEQQALAQQIGIEQYLDEFANWFSENTSGACER